MVLSRVLHDLLVPDGPAHRRTDRDEYADTRLRLRRDAARILNDLDFIPGLQSPVLVSSYDGAIEQILFCFPAWAVRDPVMASGYQSLIKALRQGTTFVVVHSESTKQEIIDWFDAAGHEPGAVAFVSMPDYIEFMDWAEDGYVSLQDAADGTTYLVEPWEFPRAGDALVADAVSDSLPIRTQQAPLIFQGGNCLVGDTFWMLGRDYFADTLTLLREQRPPARAPDAMSLPDFARQLFSDYVDGSRRLVLVGTPKAIPLRSFRGLRSGDDYFLDIAAEGAGTYQPIFHIDMFLTLLGPREDEKFEVMLGDPSLADRILGVQSPWALPDVYDTIAAALIDQGFVVHRNPLVHWPTVTQQLSFDQLSELSSQPRFEELVPAVSELRQLGAVGGAVVSVRTWHHITWNNCLVENSLRQGRQVYMPTFGYDDKASLSAVDDRMEEIWRERGFEVHRLGDFNAFAERQGVVHCLKKYLKRS